MGKREIRCDNSLHGLARLLKAICVVTDHQSSPYDAGSACATTSEWVIIRRSLRPSCPTLPRVYNVSPLSTPLSDNSCVTNKQVEDTYVVDSMQQADVAEKSEDSFDDIVPDSGGVVNVLLGQRQGNVGRVILPSFRLLWVPDTETEPPHNTHDEIGKKVGRGEGVTL